ncbi:metallophosphoesterase [Paludisphaera mucosa]|uniref:Metallophosphoesterase n=1 Tax=Paludisphaera mucosa TaxID=3030827 RepID=A0ABT6FEK2_9BACT|nr:metallophosphoesterase [Paludisphaera mucosa]MDG3005800.1 metallophosphoesterase [Paludisphaera mucosa]
MFSTLLFYATFAIGEAASIVFAINVVHGFPWKVRWTEHATLAALAVCGLISFESTRRHWMVPVSEWPPPLVVFAVFCSAVAVVGLPVATLARLRRGRLAESMPRERRAAIVDAPRAGFIGDGSHAWMLRLPGNTSLDLETHDWSVPFRRLPSEMDGLSILHLTDLHFSRAYDRRYFEAVCDVAADMTSDVVVVTGDLIDDPECIDWIAPFLERLPGRLGRFAILGNHDQHHDIDRIAEAATDAGFTVLDGHVATIDVNGRRLAVGGTCAPWGPAIADDAIPESDFSILLSHTPDQVYKAARQGWDFILCGHNHGGQVRLPVIGPVLMPSRYSRRFDLGFFEVPPSLMYVSQGIGSKHPIRYGCTPEISRFTLVPAAAVATPHGHHAAPERSPIRA